MSFTAEVQAALTRRHLLGDSFGVELRADTLNQLAQLLGEGCLRSVVPGG